MPIDLGNTPTGTVPTAAEKLQMRTALGLGMADSPSFTDLNLPGYLNGTNVAMNPSGTFGFVVGSTSSFAFVSSSSNPFVGPDAYLRSGGPNTVYQRNGNAAQNFLLANTYTDAANYERATFGFTANVLRVGTEHLGTGVARAIDFVVGGTAKVSIYYEGLDSLITIGSGATGRGLIKFGDGGPYLSGLGGGWGAQDFTFSSLGGHLFLGNGTNTILRIGGTTASFPALKRSGTRIQSRLANDAGFAEIQGRLMTDNSYTATPLSAPHPGYLIIYDDNGTGYKIPAEPA